MDRRNFLRSGSIAGASIAAISITGCQVKIDKEPKDKVAELADNFELNELTIDDLQAQMQKNEHNARGLAEHYIQRIKEIDQAGPTLRSIIELNPDALTIADQMDAERKAGKIRGPLHGIPVVIKDNIDTADKMQTTAGSLAMEGNIASKDAFIVKKLREAGAVIIGKTNLSEWANFRSSKSCSGWSSRGGQTKNPYLLDHNPCGSSSGSGAAVAANLCAVAIGTETDGSVTCPASVNGVVGIKPTIGLVSRSGIIPISSTQDTAGPIARTVKDCAMLLSVITGIDAEDAITKTSEGKAQTDYTKFLDPNGLKGKRIGIEKKPQSENTFIVALFKKALDVLKQQGAEIVEIEYFDKIGALGEQENEILKHEFKYGLNKYLQASNAKVKSLKDLIAFNKANEEKTMPYFKQDTLESAEMRGDLNSKPYLEGLKKSHEGSKKLLDDLISTNKLDAIAGITMGPACSTDMWYGDRWGDVYAPMAPAIAGYPHITVPCGMVYALPVGLSFFSGAYTEPALIGMAYAYEQATKSRVKPEFKVSIT